MLSEPARGPAVSGTALLPAAWKLDSVRAVHARSDGYRHAPFTPACGTRTEASRTNNLHPALAQACTRRAPAAAVLRKPFTSLTTINRLGKCQPMKSSIACANEARPPKVSSARWAVSRGRAGKVHAMHRGSGLKYAARVFDSGGAHRTSSPVRGGNPRGCTPLRRKRAHASRQR